MALIPPSLRGPRFGWKRNEHDARDWDEQKLGLPTARAGDLMHMVGLQTVLDQPGNSCTGHGLVQSMVVAERYAYLQGHPGATVEQAIARCEIDSPLFAYYAGRRLEPGASGKVSDVGAYPRLVAKAVATWGVPNISTWSPRIAAVNRKPKPEAWYEGVKSKRAKFYFIRGGGEERLAAVRAALAAGKPVGFGTGVDAAIFDHRGPAIVGVPRSIAGMHFMCLIGARYVDGRWLFTVVQSYGRGYRNGGLFEITDEYLAWHMTGDLTVLDDWQALHDARNAA
jgi:hypothetical protein